MDLLIHVYDTATKILQIKLLLNDMHSSGAYEFKTSYTFSLKLTFPFPVSLLCP